MGRSVMMCNDNNNKEASLTRMVATLERGRARVQEMQFLIASIKMCFGPKSSILGERGNKLASDAAPLQLGECAFDSRHAVGCNHCHCYSIVLLLPIQLVNGFGLFLVVIVHSPSGKMSYMEDP